MTLDGAASSDPDENYPLSYEWMLISKPIASSAALIDGNTANPTFTADSEGDFIIRLHVLDSMGILSAADTVTVSTFNTAPIADSGVDQSISLVGQIVYLDGTQSSDPDGDTIGYQWHFVEKPQGSAAALNDSTIAEPFFTADANGTYILHLTVEDIWSYSDASTVTISFANVAPTADAGLNQSLLVGNVVTLDGGASTDVNADEISYQWSLASIPQGSTATLSDSTVVSPTFLADISGEYIASLVVNDGLVDSTPSNVSIVAIDIADAITQKLQSAIDSVNGYDDNVFKRKAKNKRNKLVRRLTRALNRVDKQKYNKAIKRLENGVLSKLSGCAENSVPNNQDWIIDCAAQQHVQELVLEAIVLIEQVIAQQ